MQQEQHRAVADPGQFGTEAPVKTLLLMLPHHGGLILLPLLAERRIGQPIVKPFTGVLVVRQGAAQLDVLRQITARIGLQGAQQHAGKTNRMGFRLQLLAIGNQDRGHLEAVTQFINMVHGIRQHAARAARGVIEGADQPRVLLKEGIIRIEQKRGRQMHDIPRRHEVFSRLIDLGAKATNQMLIDVAHHPVRDDRGVQVDGSKVLADFVEQAGPIQSGDGVGEIELVEDDPGVIRELGDVVLKVLAGPRPTQ